MFPCVPHEVLMQVLPMLHAGRCRAATDAAWGVFRQRWAGLHPLNAPRRAQALALLQPLAELQVHARAGLISLTFQANERVTR